MSALNLAQVLWEERLALAGKPLHFPPAPNLKNQNDDPGAISNDGEEELREQKPQERPEVTVEERPIKIADIYVKLNEDNRWALCLSGGGIRSAAFAFGILQRFAAQSIASKHKADESQPSLQQFEYLSTVSGGGYIGSWLSAWLFQERRKYAFAVADKAGDTKTLDVNKVVAALNQRLTDVVDGHGRVMDHEEAESISNLRRDTHYLAPSFSAISPDLWSDIAGIVRNLCLNWVLLVPPMILAVLMTKALSYTVIDSFKINEQSPWFVLIMIMGTLCLISAVSFSAANRPARGLINASQEQFLKYDMAIFLVGASLLVFILGSPNGQTTLSEVIRLVGGQLIDNMENKWLPLAVLVRGTILGVVIYAASWLVGYAWRAMLRESPQPALGPKTRYARFDFFTWCGAGAVFGVLIAAGWLAIVYSHAADQHKAMLVGVFGLPWIVLARVIADVVFIAFAEFIPGADAGLEYQARS
ncbi:MAG: patatin-like phospholipase family protein, partial [Blastocatellia bacterium]|nr:patatin-like phospholipase family protein [Blastocatellia bacterium]